MKYDPRRRERRKEGQEERLTKEEVLCVCRVTSDLQQSDQIKELAMHVSAHLHNGEHHEQGRNNE